MAKTTLHRLQKMKEQGERIAMLTAYDYPTGQLLDAAGVEMILVGDSLGMVVHGLETTIPVTMDMMILHCAAVRRGVKNALLIGDMPFGSYQIDLTSAKKNAARLMAEGGVDAVKLEGGESVADTIRELVEMGIAVQGHVGLTPQSVSAMGGFRVQGKSLDAARQVVRDAIAVERAGAFSIVLEGVPARLAKLITQQLTIPTIGIGAGLGCDGQVLVLHDMLGLFYERHVPKFVKQYTDLRTYMLNAFAQYRDEVKQAAFPTTDHEYDMPDDVWAILQSEFESRESS